MMLALKNCGHRVFVLTGALTGEEGDPYKWKKERLEQYGFTGITPDDLKVALKTETETIAQAKARICREEKVNVFIDDEPQYIQAVNEGSPETLCLYVVPK